MLGNVKQKTLDGITPGAQVRILAPLGWLRLGEAEGNGWLQWRRGNHVRNAHVSRPRRYGRKGMNLAFSGDLAATVRLAADNGLSVGQPRREMRMAQGRLTMVLPEPVITGLRHAP